MLHSSDRKGPLYIAAAALCWSFGGLCIKFIPWGAMCIIGLRSLLAALLFALYNKRIKINFTSGNILSAICLSGTTLVFVFATKLTTAAAAILLQYTSPIFIILINLAVYKKKPKTSEIIAVSVTLIGMLMFFFDSLEAGNLLGNLLAISSGLFFAGVFIFNKREDTNPDQALFFGFLINAIIGIPFTFFEATADLLAWGLIIFMGLVQVGLAYIFFSFGIKRTSALFACLIAAFEPVLNPIWVALFMGEVPGMFAVMGGAVIIVTVVSYNVWVEKHT